MWDRPETLNRAADVLLMVAVALVLYAALYQAIRMPVFALREVRLAAPARHLAEVDLARLVRQEIRGTFFTVDLARTRAALEKLPWVRSASIRRQWPDGLVVSLEEHEPLARWADAGLVSTHGERFDAAYGKPLPVFAGPPDAAKEMAIQYEYFRASLAAIGRVPERIHLSPRRAWQIQLDGGTILELGREQMEARLSRFVAVYPRTLVPFNRPLDYVDLRYANGFAVRLPAHRPQGTERKAAERS